MAKPKILVQLDSDPQASVFDAVVAVDAGVEHLLQHASVEPTGVRDLVYGAMFTRGPEDLHQTAIFIGGSNVSEGEEILAQVRDCFFGPMRVSVMLDANGANTTAAAAVLSAARHLDLQQTTALVLAGTGPVGQRVSRLLAREGARVRVGSRSRDRAGGVCEAIREKLPEADVTPHSTVSPEERREALAGAQLVVAAGAAAVQLLAADEREAVEYLQVAIDLNAVPPVGLEGVEVTDKAKQQGDHLVYGAIGVGGLKMKIHKAAIERLFVSNDAVLDAEEIHELGRNLQPSG